MLKRRFTFRFAHAAIVLMAMLLLASCASHHKRPRKYKAIPCPCENQH